MPRDGYEDEHVAVAILEASPSLFERQWDAEDYGRRTVAKARQGLSLDIARGPGSERGAYGSFTAPWRRAMVCIGGAE